MKNPVVYMIKNSADGRVYIGSTIEYDRRAKVHFRELRNKKHKNKFMQAAWDKYGEESFSIQIVEEAHGNLLEREQFWIDQFKETRYNLCSVALRSAAMVSTPEANEKRSVALKGKKRGEFSQEWKANLSAAQRRRKHEPFTEEQKARCSAAQKGRIITEDHKAKLRAAWVKRRSNEKSSD